jgi:hypothetical protein
MVQRGIGRKQPFASDFCITEDALRKHGYSGGPSDSIGLFGTKSLQSANTRKRASWNYLSQIGIRKVSETFQANYS